MEQEAIEDTLLAALLATPDHVQGVNVLDMDPFDWSPEMWPNVTYRVRHFVRQWYRQGAREWFVWKETT